MGGTLRPKTRRRTPFTRVVLAFASAWLGSLFPFASVNASSDDWQLRIRQLVQHQELTAALVVAEDRLGAHPEDLEARGWRARLLAWTQRWSESELEYLAVLQSAPHDTDILVGLADLLTWQGRSVEAIPFLDQASLFDPGRNDVQLRRGRLLHALGRRAEAGVAYAHVLSIDGLSVGLEHRKSLLDSLNTGASSEWLMTFSRRGPASREPGNESYRRFGRALIRWEAADSGQSLVELCAGGCLPRSNGLNYAVRF